MLRGEKWDCPVKSGMSYFRLSLILHYRKNYQKLFFISKRNAYEGPNLLVVVSSAVVRYNARYKILSKLTRTFKFFFFFLPVPSFPQVHFSFVSFRQCLIRSLNLKKHFSDKLSYIPISFFFSGWTILWYKSSLNRGVQWSANSSS